MKQNEKTEEEVEGPTSSCALRKRITLLTLQEHDDDDDDDEPGYAVLNCYKCLKMVR